ncbi:MAG: Mut7-C RNAse domain-containing protein [Methanomassiliicoccales archaeon]|nr:Mut7-C RNAse domain-containing protein [Methanomassiliicoccales archaeon]
MRSNGDPEPSFLLDGMLGSLARWLRILGYDALYLRDVLDADILSTLLDNERILLTRDKQLATRAGPRGLLIVDRELDAQLETVVAMFDLRLDQEPRRCTACNGKLRSVERSSVKGEVREGTWNGHQEFWRCADCGKVYWRGAHWKNIRLRIASLSKDRGNVPR